MPPWHVQENKWRAARYGLDAVIILDEDSNERLVTEDLDDLLNRLEPVAKSLGCADELAAVADISAAGASYQRQRRVAEEHDGDLRAVVDALVAELESDDDRSRIGPTADVPAASRRCCPARNCRCGSSSRATARWCANACAMTIRFGVVLIAAGREVGGEDVRCDVGAMAHIVECQDFGGRADISCDARCASGSG